MLYIRRAHTYSTYIRTVHTVLILYKHTHSTYIQYIHTYIQYIHALIHISKAYAKIVSKISSTVSSNNNRPESDGIKSVCSGSSSATVEDDESQEVAHGSRYNGAAQQYIHDGECMVLIQVNLSNVSESNAQPRIDTVEEGIVNCPALCVCIEEDACEEP